MIDQAGLAAADHPESAADGGGGEEPGQMVTQLAGQRLGVGDEGDLAAHVQASGRDLHAERSAANHDDRGARRDAFLEEYRILDGAQGELPGRAVPLRSSWPGSRGEALRPGSGGDDKAVIRQLTAPVEADQAGVDVETRGADPEQLGRVVARLGQLMSLEIVDAAPINTALTPCNSAFDRAGRL